MKCKIKGFTLLSSLLAMFLTVLLTAALITVFFSVYRRYHIISNLGQMHDNAIYLMSLLTKQFKQSEFEFLSENQFKNSYHKSLHSLSKILVISRNKNKTCYYLANTSWKFEGKTLESIFRKPLLGQRQELVPNVVAFDLEKNTPHNLTLGFVLRSSDKLLRTSMAYDFFKQKRQAIDKHVYQVWYGKTQYD